MRDAAIGKNALVYSALVPSLMFLYFGQLSRKVLLKRVKIKTYLDQVLKHKFKILEFSIMKWIH